MIKQDIVLIDELIAMIKGRIDSGETKAYDKFEFYLILTLEITRYELYSSGKITNLTAKALTQLFAFQCFEIYYRNYPEVYSKCSELSQRLVNYNQKCRDDELGTVGVKNWIKYFEKSVSQLILSNKHDN